MLRARILNGLLFVFVSLFYIFSDTYLALVLLILICVLFVTSLLVSFIVKNKVEMTLDSSHSFYRGEEGTFKIRLINRSFLPIIRLKFYVQIENVMIDEQYAQEINLSLKGKSQTSLPLHLQSEAVGKIRMWITDVSVFDFFGNFNLKRQWYEQSEFYILPIPYPISISKADIASSLNDLLLDNGIKKGIDTYDILGFKEYEMGDNIRQIHWKLSSKIDDFIVKEMREPIEISQFILLEPALKEKDTQEINQMVEAFYSLSKTLLNHAQVHSVGWYDGETNSLHVKEIQSLDQLNVSLREILGVRFQHSDAVGLEAFIQSAYYLETSHLFYIKSQQIETEQMNQLHHMEVTTVQYQSSAEKVSFPSMKEEKGTTTAYRTGAL